MLQSYSLDGINLDTWRSEPLFEDCTDGFIISRDAHMVANVCVHWFRDSHEFDLAELGCEHYRAVSLVALSPPTAESDNLSDWRALSIAEQDAYVAEALLRSGLTHPGDEVEP